MQDGIYDSDEGRTADEQDEGEARLDLGEDTKDEMDEAPNSMVQEAVQPHMWKKAYRRREGQDSSRFWETP